MYCETDTRFSLILKKSGRLSQGGFSMIEVLVSLVIISFALLGAAGLQAYAIRTNQGGNFRSQAVLLASDLAERMEANASTAINYTNYEQATSSKIDTTLNVQCISNICSPTQLADYDLSQWKNSISLTLPQSEWTVTRITSLGQNPSSYTIKISWVDREENVNYGAKALKGNSGTGDKMSYTATRTFFIDPP